MRILLANHEKAIVSLVKRGLGSESYAVDIAAEGEEARYMAEEFDYDLLILDLKLPPVDGFNVLRHVRIKKTALPILVLTGPTGVEDRVKCLDQGADDCLTKPFAFSELLARVRALLRRRSQPADLVLRVTDLEMNRVSRVVTRGERRIELTLKEFALLEYLMRNAGRCLSRTMILEHVWDLSSNAMTNVVDVYICYLRSKVDKAFEFKLIRTVRGVGYQIGPRE